MDNIDDYVLSLSNILKRVDEYELYCHYLGFEPEVRCSYSSPLREGDNTPSFSFFDTETSEVVEFYWKDAGANISGSISTLVREMYGLSSIREALTKIDQDFDLGFTSGTAYKHVIPIRKRKLRKKTASDIIISSKPFSKEARAYWETFGITLDTLRKYNVTQLNYYILNNTTFYCDFSFAYKIGDKYKVYSPRNSKYRFINNYHATFIEGYLQLDHNSNTLIITKSTKDVMALYEMGYEAISPRSESTPIPEVVFPKLDKMYKNIYVLFDNDLKHNGHLYPYPKIYVPLNSGCKDISDYVEKYSKDEAKELMIKLLKR
jgi:hypothetical protein